MAAFPNSNEGDVSPNTKGPRCIDTGLSCDIATSSCPDTKVNTFELIFYFFLKIG